MGYGELYQQFHHDEPWNSPHNLSLLDQMPDEFRSRGLPVGTNYSGYRLFEGNGAYEYDSDGGPWLGEAGDGRQHTLLVMETMPHDAAPWTKPDGIPFDQADPLAGLTLPPDTFLVGTVDGTIRQVRPTVSAENFSAITTWDNGEILTAVDYADIYHDWDVEDTAEVSADRVKALVLAMHNFHDVHATFPPGRDVPSEWFDPSTGVPYLSWRVHLLPYLGYGNLYNQFHLDEPWDSPHNIQLLDEMPEDLRSRGLAPGGTLSAFKLITAEEAYDVHYLNSPYPQLSGPQIRDIVDGTDSTIAIVELTPDKAVPWTQWNEVEFNAADPLDGIGPIPEDGLRVGMTDGVVHNLNPDAISANFGIFATWQGGEVFGPAESSNVFLDWALPDSKINSWEKLRDVGLAFHNYHDVFGYFPISGGNNSYDPTTEMPYLSWRVHLLPYLGYANLYNEFHLDEPWDSPHNIQLLDKMPEVFRSRGLAANSSMTGIQLLLGEGAYEYTYFEPNSARGPRYRDISDGTHATIAVVEVMSDLAVEWTRPDGDIPFDILDPLAGVGTIPEDGLRVLTFDGAVFTLNPDVTAENFKAFATLDGGEIFGPAESSNVFLDWQRPPHELPQVEHARSRIERLNKLKQIGLGLHNFHDVYARFPVGNTPQLWDPETELPYLSWRVHLLPYIGYENLYYQFHLDEPWDSPHNIQLLDKMPEIFRSRGLPSDSTKTGFQLFLGEGAYDYQFVNSSNYSYGYGPRIRDITDGTSRTIAVIETMPEDAVEWTRSDGDIMWDPTNPFGGLTMPPNIFNVLMFDGSTRSFHPLLDEDTFRSYVTFAGGEII